MYFVASTIVDASVLLNPIAAGSVACENDNSLMCVQLCFAPTSITEHTYIFATERARYFTMLILNFVYSPFPVLGLPKTFTRLELYIFRFKTKYLMML